MIWRAADASSFASIVERIRFHRLAGRLPHDLVVLLQQAAEVAVGDDAVRAARRHRRPP